MHIFFTINKNLTANTTSYKFINVDVLFRFLFCSNRVLFNDKKKILFLI